MSRSQASFCVCTSCPISIRAKLTLINSSVTLWRKTPHLNCLPSTVPIWLPRRVPYRLDVKVLKMAVSLSDPHRPRAVLQILTTTLRSKTLKSIPSCSKASGVFSSAAGIPHLHGNCIFTELIVETVLRSLRLSCASELTRKGIALNCVTTYVGQNISAWLSMSP